MTSHKPVLKAVFPVAGMGTRNLPATKVMPKEMLTVVDRPLIQYGVEEAREAGIKEIIFVISGGKDVLIKHFEHDPALIAKLRGKGKDALVLKVLDSDLPAGQPMKAMQDEPLGLGHAIWCAKDRVGDEPFAIILPDDLVLTTGKGCLSQMVETYNQVGGNLVGVMEVPPEQTSSYGILDISADYGRLVEIKGLVEKPKPEDAPSNLSIIGRYILQPEVFQYLAEKVVGAGGEIQLTDAMARLIGQQPFHGMRYEGERHDCGSKAGLVKANIAYGLRDPDIGQEIAAYIQGPKL